MHVLPIEAYTSQEWFDREQKQIFSKVWRYAGFVEDLTQPGQYIAVQAGLNSIFIVMGEDKKLRAFHNICRHRGTQLLRAVGKTQKAITCPYHDWTYDLDGNLISVPDEEPEFPALDKSCLSLKAASVATWRGMLFVHPDPNVGPIADWFGEIEPRLGPHKVDELVEYPDAASSKEVKANWKIVVENYIDVYHLAHLHSGTLAMYDHAKAEYGFVGPHYTCWEPLSSEYRENIKQNAPMPLILDEDQLGASVPMLFPGLGLSEDETSWSIFHVFPVAPDLTRIETRTKVKNASSWEFMKQEWRSWSFWKKQITGKYDVNDSSHENDPMTSGDFMAEDIYACEQQQKSLQSPYFEVGPSAQNGEGPVRQHQQIVLDYMNEEDTPSKTPDKTKAISAKKEQVEGVRATVEVVLQGEACNVLVDTGQTILDAAREAGLEPPFSCESGICGKCQAQLVEGNVHMKACMALDDREIENGTILTCQAVPLTSSLRVEY
jgi:Rieske 2Fe-2S family protein